MRALVITPALNISTLPFQKKSYSLAKEIYERYGRSIRVKPEKDERDDTIIDNETKETKVNNHDGDGLMEHWG